MQRGGKELGAVEHRLLLGMTDGQTEGAERGRTAR